MLELICINACMIVECYVCDFDCELMLDWLIVWSISWVMLDSKYIAHAWKFILHDKKIWWKSWILQEPQDEIKWHLGKGSSCENGTLPKGSSYMNGT